MDPNKQRIAIARALGWKRLPKDPEMVQYTAEMPNGKWDLIPDYTRSLDAMHEAEKRLTRAQKIDYLEELQVLTGSYSNSVYATADTRAEAFLRTLNLWQEP